MSIKKPMAPEKAKMSMPILALNLMQSYTAWMSLYQGYLLSRQGYLPASNHAQKEIKDLLQQINNEEIFIKTLNITAFGGLQNSLNGISLYLKQSRKKRTDNPPVIWQKNSVKLYDYGVFNNSSKTIPMLVIPSLINRYYVLDLMPELSFLRFMAKQNIRPFIIDWGDECHKNYDISDYINNILSFALQKVIDISNKKPIINGYCMGGNIALALSYMRQTQIKGLVLMATPWDFHSQDYHHISMQFVRLWHSLEPFIKILGFIPADMLQTIFLSIFPVNSARKFAKFSQNYERKPELNSRHFIALEDWLNDGIDVAYPTMQECVLHWYKNNDTMSDKWKINNVCVKVKDIDIPTIAVIPQKDVLVPPESAMPLVKSLPKADKIVKNLGHIGMVASRKAPSLLWDVLAKKIKNID